MLLAFQCTVEHFLQTLEDLELPSFKTSLLLRTLQIFEDILKDFSNTFSILSNLQKHFHDGCSFSSKKKQTSKTNPPPTSPKQTSKQKNPKHLNDSNWDSVLFQDVKTPFRNHKYIHYLSENCAISMLIKILPSLTHVLE